MKTIKHNGYTLNLNMAKYGNGQTAIRLIDTEDGMLFAIASVSLVNHHLSTDEVAIKDYSENEGILQSLIDSGIVEKPHRNIQSGFVTIPICKLI
jgi:hypothetical protein